VKRFLLQKIVAVPVQACVKEVLMMSKPIGQSGGVYDIREIKATEESCVQWAYTRLYWLPNY